MDIISDLLSLYGFTADIALATANAYQDPSTANINAVVRAYADNGQVIPAKMYGFLAERHKEVYPDEPLVNINPAWGVLAVGLGVWFFFGRR